MQSQSRWGTVPPAVDSLIVRGAERLRLRLSTVVGIEYKARKCSMPKWLIRVLN